MQIIDHLLALAELTTFRSWILHATRVMLALLILSRTVGNIREILYVRGLGKESGRYYTLRHWGTRPCALILILIVDSVVVIVAGIIAVIISSD